MLGTGPFIFHKRLFYTAVLHKPCLTKRLFTSDVVRMCSLDEPLVRTDIKPTLKIFETGRQGTVDVLLWSTIGIFLREAEQVRGRLEPLPVFCGQAPVNVG